MDLTTFNLRDSCVVDTNQDGDRFVGVKIEEDKAVVYFPLGYHLPDDDRLLRRDIRALFGVLSTFANKEDVVLRGRKFTQAHPVDFPIVAYLDVLDYYMENNGHYYTVTEKRYKSDSKGKIDFRRTAKKEKAFIKNGSLIYTNFQVEYQSPLENVLITNIHKYCVYQSFKRLGWLYTSQSLPKPGIAYDKNSFLAELRKRYRYCNIDRDKKLFKSMIAMIEFEDNRVLDKSFYFGTDDFEYVWEKVIDKVFGVSNKEDYFPHAVWSERHGVNKDKETKPLLPDTIMVYGGKVYVLDAKFYKYGATHDPSHLPDASSINKQITYAEYIETPDPSNPKKPTIDHQSLFNAFIMPYDANENLFETNDLMVNVAEAKGKWRLNTKYYEKIQGIVIDVRTLLLNHAGNHDAEKKILSEKIEQYLITH